MSRNTLPACYVQMVWRTIQRIYQQSSGTRNFALSLRPHGNNFHSNIILSALCNAAKSPLVAESQTRIPSSPSATPPSRPQIIAGTGAFRASAVLYRQMPVKPLLLPHMESGGPYTNTDDAALSNFSSNQPNLNLHMPSPFVSKNNVYRDSTIQLGDDCQERNSNVRISGRWVGEKWQISESACGALKLF